MKKPKTPTVPYPFEKSPEEVLKDNIRLAYFAAHGVTVLHLDIEEKIQIALVAIYDAIPYFDPKKAQFRTYAVNTARWALIEVRRLEIQRARRQGDIEYAYQQIIETRNEVCPKAIEDTKAALSRLSDKDRNFLEGLCSNSSYAKAAKSIGMSIEGVRKKAPKVLQVIKEFCEQTDTGFNIDALLLVCGGRN